MKNYYLKIIISVVFISILNCSYVLANATSDPFGNYITTNEFKILYMNIFIIAVFMVITGLFALKYLRNKRIKQSEKNNTNNSEDQIIID